MPPLINPKQPKLAVRESVLVTGSDGYAALLALGEIAPFFEHKKIILATKMNGKYLGPLHLRIIVPGDSQRRPLRARRGAHRGLVGRHAAALSGTMDGNQTFPYGKVVRPISAWRQPRSWRTSSQKSLLAANAAAKPRLAMAARQESYRLHAGSQENGAQASASAGSTIRIMPPNPADEASPMRMLEVPFCQGAGHRQHGHERRSRKPQAVPEANPDQLQVPLNITDARQNHGGLARALHFDTHDKTIREVSRDHRRHR